MKRAAIFCSGFGSNFQAILDANKKNRLGFELAVLICDNPKAHALKRAQKHNIPVVLISPKLFNSREDYEKLIVRILKSQKVDFVILAGFMRILTNYFVQSYKNKILNIHPSYLPAFKGPHAICDAFEAKVKETGVTVHVVTLKLDSGPILTQKKVKILPKDTLETLEKRIHKVEHALYPKAISQFAKELR